MSRRCQQANRLPRPAVLTQLTLFALLPVVALLAWPDDYRASGVMTFMVSHQGLLLEKDLGPDTGALAQAMTEYDPDASWKGVDAP